MESTFSTSRFWPLKLSRTATLVQGRDNPPGQGGVMAYLRQELPLGANTIPLAAFSFMSGYLNAVAFTTCAIWCGFMTGNSVMLGLALARVSLGHRREAAFAINDAQATTALVTFVFGIALARVGDLSIWSGPKPINHSSPVNQDLEKASQPELGARPSASSNDLADSGAPTRVGTPVAFSQIPRLIVPSAPTPGPSSPLDNSPTNTLPPAKLDPKPETPAAPARTRLWLITGTLFQALLLVGAAVAAIHDPTRASSVAAGAVGNPRAPLGAPWSTVYGFTALGLMSLSMGFQGVMAHRMGSGFGATVVLSSLWVELVGSPGGIRWREYRGARVYTILLFIAGGLVGAVFRDASILGVPNSIFVGAGMRVAIAFSWLFVKGPRPNRV
ncbi:putative transmembrane protein [Rhizoctonia solani 123E]|uniref:Putative transmembrane protein n=1 Tax=Rhizoctonia solani 123E TaxID=1423351 RepID=A0A074SIU0_9AGAM|nr:putative transmembrane protein [Rhizoctonia solani 123E]